MSAPFHFTADASSEFQKRLARYLAAVQATPLGTTRDGHHGAFMELGKFLVLINPILDKYDLAYSMHQAVDGDGRVKCRFWFGDLAEGSGAHAAWTDWQVSGKPPANGDIFDFAKFQTYFTRRCAMFIHGVWSDSDFDGLTADEFREAMQSIEDRRNQHGQDRDQFGQQAPGSQPDEEGGRWWFDEEGALLAKGAFSSQKASQKALMTLWQDTFKPVPGDGDNELYDRLQTMIDANWATFAGHMTPLGVAGMDRRLAKAGYQTPYADEQGDD